MLCASCFVEKLYLLTHGKSIFIIPVSLKDEQKLYDKNISIMTMTASQMGKNSAKARRKKYGGKKGFAKHMSDIANKRYL